MSRWFEGRVRSASLLRRARLLTALVWLGACGGGIVGTDSGGESHFLARCVDRCEGGLDCISGICTRGCVLGSDSCADLAPNAECTNASVEPGAVAVCDVSCRRDRDCSGLGDGFTCDDGFCRGPKQPFSPGAGGGNAGGNGDPVGGTSPEAEGGAAAQHSGGAGNGGGGNSGSGPEPACSPDGIKLRAIEHANGRNFWNLNYDDQGRVSSVQGNLWNLDLQYDEQSRITTTAGDDDGLGWEVTYGPGTLIKYVSDDGLTPRDTYVSDGYWSREVTYYEPSSRRDERLATWSGELLSSVLTRHLGQEPTTEETETFTYDYDEYSNPVRMISSKGPSAAPTTEVFDAGGHHLFQWVQNSAGALDSVRLYRENTGPNRSLFGGATPKDVANLPWLRASFDPDGELEFFEQLWSSPRDFTPWRPLSFDPTEVADFARDLDGDDEIDVKGQYVFDELGRFSAFTLELSGAPRIVVQSHYSPALITQTVDYPGRDRQADVYNFYYGCDDFVPLTNQPTPRGDGGAGGVGN